MEATNSNTTDIEMLAEQMRALDIKRADYDGRASVAFDEYLAAKEAGHEAVAAKALRNMNRYEAIAQRAADDKRDARKRLNDLNRLAAR